MKIQNISTSVYILAGVKIQPNQIVTAEDFGEEFVFEQYREDFEDALLSNAIIFLTDDDEQITVISEIETELTEDTNIIDIKDTSKDFYYNFKTFDIPYNETVTIQFQGYLKTIDVIADSGNIEIQIIQPKMNKIFVQETNNYIIDADYKLKNPVIKISGITSATVQLYMDGTFDHETKTKEQYLNEIYSDNYFPDESEIDNNNLQFKVNFKQNMTSETFRDVIGNNIGCTYHNRTLLNFNKFEDGAYVKFNDLVKLQTDKPFTFNIWFKSFEDVTAKQYIVYKKDYIELYIYKSKLYAVIDRCTTLISDIEPDKYYMFTASYANSMTNFYIDNMLTSSLSKRWTFTPSFQYLYFGSKAGSYSLRSAEIGEVNYYSYHLSHGMVRNLYMHNNPNTQFKDDLVKGCVLNTYTNTSSLDIDSSYTTTILLKEVARLDNLLTTESLSTLEYNNTDSNLKVFLGFIYIPEDGKYTFENTYDDKFCFTIDEKEVLLNQSTKTIYIEEGYYKFKLVTEDKVNIICGKKGTTLTTPLIFTESENTPLYINLDDRESTHDVIFDNNVLDLHFDNETTSVRVTDKFFSEVFTLSMEIQNLEDSAQIFAQGTQWDEYVILYITNNKIVLNYQNGWFGSNINLPEGFNKIDITCNGSQIFLYINGILDKNGYYSSIPKTNTKLYFGSAGEGNIYPWLEGEFNLKNVSYKLKYTEPSAIINSFKRGE